MEPVIMGALLGSALGILKSDEEKRMFRDRQNAEAEKTRYGHWTGQWGQNLDAPAGDLSHIGTGALAGGMLGQQLGGSLGGGESAVGEEEVLPTDDDLAPDPKMIGKSGSTHLGESVASRSSAEPLNTDDIDALTVDKRDFYRGVPEMSEHGLGDSLRSRAELDPGSQYENYYMPDDDELNVLPEDANVTGLGDSLGYRNGEYRQRNWWERNIQGKSDWGM